MSLSRSGHKTTNVELDGAQLKQATSKTCLGINIDSELNFKEHVDIVSKRAFGALSKLSSLISQKPGISMCEANFGRYPNRSSGVQLTAAIKVSKLDQIQ